MYICLYIKYSLKDIHQIANSSFLLLELSVFIFSFYSCNFLIHLQQVFIICIKKKKLKTLLNSTFERSVKQEEPIAEIFLSKTVDRGWEGSVVESAAWVFQKGSGGW